MWTPMYTFPRPSFSSFFFFNDTATTEIYTLSLHDALPIWFDLARHVDGDQPVAQGEAVQAAHGDHGPGRGRRRERRGGRLALAQLAEEAADRRCVHVGDRGDAAADEVGEVAVPVAPVGREG